MHLELPDIPLATDVGPYHVLQCLGLGARGAVYLAEDRLKQQRVAIKFMGWPADMDEYETRARFEREAQALSLFSHPHIVKFEGNGRVQVGGHEVHYLVMEYLHDLQPLDVAARAHGRGDWLLDRVEELLLALDYMHSHDYPVVHRDLKPGNLGVPADGRLRVLDLGLARVQKSNLTSQGSAMGSLGYMAPEQLMDGKSVDHQADIYAVGMILLELLGGGHPMHNMTSGRTVRAVITGHIPSTPAPLPEPLDRLARWCCALNPKQRPATAAVALHELRAVRQRLKEAPTPSAMPSEPSPRGSGWNVSLTFLGQQLMAACGGQGNAILVCGRSEPDRRVLLDAVCQHAQSMGMGVCQVDDANHLAQWLGTLPQPGALLDGLKNRASKRPFFIYIPALPEDDTILSDLMQLEAGSGIPVLLLAATQTAPADPGCVTVLHLR